MTATPSSLLKTAREPPWVTGPYFSPHNKRAMTSTCSYNPVGGIPKDGSFTSGLRSKNLVACSGKFNDIEANTVLVNETLTAKDVIDASNVLYYGADPTGVADSTAAFQSALASTEDCSVYVPGGTYLITATLAIPANKVMVGQCQRGTTLSFANNAANFDCITMASGSALRQLVLDYAGTNSATTTMISVLGQDVVIDAVYMAAGDTECAWGLAFETVATNASISNSTIHGVLIAVRWTAAYSRCRFVNCLINCGTNGTCVNTTASAVPNTIVGSLLRANGGASTGVNAAVAIVLVANSYVVTTPLTGAALLTSTIFDNLTSDTVPTSVNTAGAYSVDGIKVVGNQIGGWSTTTGASVPARTLATGDNTAAQLTNAFKQLLADLNSHGLLAVTITP